MLCNKNYHGLGLFPVRETLNESNLSQHQPLGSESHPRGWVEGWQDSRAQERVLSESASHYPLCLFSSASKPTGSMWLLSSEGVSNGLPHLLTLMRRSKISSQDIAQSLPGRSNSWVDNPTPAPKCALGNSDKDRFLVLVVSDHLLGASWPCSSNRTSHLFLVMIKSGNCDPCPPATLPHWIEYNWIDVNLQGHNVIKQNPETIQAETSATLNLFFAYG